MKYIILSASKIIYSVNVKYELLAKILCFFRRPYIKRNCQHHHITTNVILGGSFEKKRKKKEGFCWRSHTLQTRKTETKRIRKLIGDNGVI
jgi:hypothetical protein